MVDEIWKKRFDSVVSGILLTGLLGDKQMFLFTYLYTSDLPYITYFYYKTRVPVSGK